MALGELGLLPWDFWRLTPREWDRMARGHRRRTRRRWYQLGLIGTWLLSPWADRGRGKLTPERLLGWTAAYRDDED